MNVLDMMLALGILVAAGWVLYRTLAKRNGCCAGCGGCSFHQNKEKGHDCQTKPDR